MTRFSDKKSNNCNVICRGENKPDQLILVCDLSYDMSNGGYEWKLF